MINTYDIDGVINMGEYTGLRPGLHDIIITGRSMFDEYEYTHKWLKEQGIHNICFMNQVKFEDKTRQNAGEHKANIINLLFLMGCKVGLHYEDDPIQADIIEKMCGSKVKVVRIVHNLIEKENVWHGPVDDSRSIKSRT